MSDSFPTVTVVGQTMFLLPVDLKSQWNPWDRSGEPIQDAECLTEFAGRLCYQSWHNPAGRTNAEYLANLIEQGHFSVLEHATVSVWIRGVSRSLTHELVRHRHLSISQLSQRYVPGLDGWVTPPLFEGDPEAQAILWETAEFLRRQYERLQAAGERILVEDEPEREAAHLGPLPKRVRHKRVREAARAVLPNMALTELVITANHRTWREIFLKRGNAHADQEMRRLAIALFEAIEPIAPGLYQDLVLDADPIDGDWSIIPRKEMTHA